MQAIRMSVLSLSALVLACLMSTPAAAVTSIGSFSGGDVGEGLDLDGSIIYAINVGPNAGLNQVRDARFHQDGYGGAEANGTTSIVTGAQIMTTNNIGAGGWGAPNYGATANDNGLETVMSSIRWSAAPNDVNVNLPNLTVGDTYKVQLLFGENCCARGFDVIAEGATIASAFSPQAVQGVPNNSTMGAVVTHEFVATDSVLNLKLDQNVPGFADNTPILNAITLEHVSATGPAVVSNVNIGTFNGGDPGEGLDVLGNFTHAVNVGGPAAIVGDISFADGNPGNNPPNAAVGAFNHIPAWAPGVNLGASANDNGLETVMQSIRWSNNVAGNDDGLVEVTLSDLTPGATYKGQLLFAEACCNNRAFDVLVDGQLIADGFAPGPNQGGATGSPTQASVISFEFMATDSMLNITLDGDPQPGGDQNPILSGFTVEQLTSGVPEPATATLSLLALGALLRRRRRAAAC